MNPSRIKDLFFYVISVSLGILFFYLAFSDTWGFGSAVLSTESWETLLLGVLGAFLLGGGIFGFAKAVGSKQQETRGPAEDKKIWLDILKMLILIAIFLVAVWAMFHLGLD